MQATLAFGKGSLKLDLPDHFQYEVLHAHAAPPVSDAAASVAAALDSPIGSAPLQELARDCTSAAISVCDITRPAPNRLTLPPLLIRLEAAGIPSERITLFIATGLHRPATRDELDVILGSEIAASYSS